MQATDPRNDDGHAAAMNETRRILEEMEKLEMRARLLLAEHRHVIATIGDLQTQLEAAVPIGRAIRPPLK